VKRTAASLILGIVFAAGLLWAQGPTQIHLGFNLFSKEQDVQLGKENADQVRKQMTVIRDPVLAAYVTRVGQRPMSAREARESGFPVYL